MLLSILIACPAEQLGIELPEGGAGAISQEDLQRDVYALTRGDPESAFARRLEEMHVTATERGDGWICGRRDAGGEARLLVAPWPEAPTDAVTVAGLVSLAKGWDTAKGPPRTTWYCMARAGAALPAGEPMPLAPFTESPSVEAVDWKEVKKAVVRRFGTLNQ